MTAANIQITQGSGTRLATSSYTEGGVTVHDEKMLLGEPYLPTYTAIAGSISVATSSDHILQIMAGASLNVRIRRIHLEQRNNATAVSLLLFTLLRLTTAGTGGTVITPGKYDNADAAAGASAMSLPTVKGTEGVSISTTILVLRQALLATGTQPEESWDWQQMPNSKPIIIPAGTTNGIAIKIGTGVAAATVDYWVEFQESSF